MRRAQSSSVKCCFFSISFDGTVSLRFSRFSGVSNDRAIEKKGEKK